MVPVFYRSVTGFDVLLIGVLRVSGGDGVVETLSEGIGVAGGEEGEAGGGELGAESRGEGEG